MSDQVIIYEDKNFKGKKKTLRMHDKTYGRLYSLEKSKIHDKMSSLRWQLSGNKEVIFYEHSDGTGRTYLVKGSGEDKNTHNNDFKDCASSWRLMPGKSVPLAFSKILHQPSVLRFSRGGIRMPSGGHMQGIQQLDSRHLVISGSSEKKAYFFIVQWPNGISPGGVGKIVTLVRINDDFPGMKQNHASGIQLTGKVLAVGTERRGDAIQSSVVFYDLSNVSHPKVVGNRIDRREDTAGAVAIVKRTSDYLLVVGGWDSEVLDFYSSNNASLTSTSCVFTKLITWQSKNKNTSGWIDGNWGNYQGLNLLRGTRGELYLVGFNRNAGGHDWADLYSIKLSASRSKMLQKLDKKHVYCQDGASFRYGGGLYAPSPADKITLLAVERDFHDRTTVNRF